MRNEKVKEQADEMLAKIMEYSLKADEKYHDTLMIELASALIVNVTCGYDNMDDAIKEHKEIMRLIHRSTLDCTIDCYTGKTKYNFRIIGKDI